MPKGEGKCDNCGKFRRPEDVFGTGNEYEDWTECVYCCSDAELEFHRLKRKKK